MVRRIVLLAILVVVGAACGDDGSGGDGDPGDRVPADPGFFAEQRFDCDPATSAPSCPPATCEVSADGEVSGCQPACGIDQFASSTVFEGPDGVDVCVPRECTVAAENAAPTCTDDCATDGDVTSYVFEYSCP